MIEERNSEIKHRHKCHVQVALITKQRVVLQMESVSQFIQRASYASSAYAMALSHFIRKAV